MAPAPSPAPPTIPAPNTRAAMSVAGALVLLEGSSGAARGLLDAVDVVGCAMKSESKEPPLGTERSTKVD